MKLKVLALSIAMAAGIFAANAQTYKGNDWFVGVGGGIISVYNDGFNSPAFYGNVMVGKWVTPAFGARFVIGGPFQTLDPKVGNAYDLTPNNPRGYKNKLFGELNLDAILNISNLFADDLAKFDFYLFAGPTMNLSSVGTKFSNAQDAIAVKVQEDNTATVRFGATAGLGLGYNITDAFELALEGRIGVTPSVFGDADKFRKHEGTGRLTLNAIYTIGGKHGKYARAAMAAAAAGYLSKEAAEALCKEYAAKHPVIQEKTVTKEVVKEVEKIVSKEIPSSTAVFFSKGKATLTEADKARLNLFAEGIKGIDSNFTINGYADKKTGSVKTNQTLSEKRAQAVYDYLISQGVPASKLSKNAEGGVGPIFFNNDALSRTVIIKTK